MNHFHSATRHTGEQEVLPVFSNLHDVTAEREKATKREEIIYNGEVSRQETTKKPFLVIRWADRGGCLIGRDWRELGDLSSHPDRDSSDLTA